MKIFSFVGLALALSLAFFNSLSAASFDCKKAGNYAERTICSEEVFSAADEELSATYKLLTAYDDNWRASQLQWLKQRNHCKTAECLLDAYQERTAYLKSEIVKVFDRNVNEQKNNILQLLSSKDESFCQSIAPVLTNKIMASDTKGSPVFSEWQVFDFPRGRLPIYSLKKNKPSSFLGVYQYIDFDADGDKELIIKKRTWIRGKDYNVLYLFDENALDLTKPVYWHDFKDVPTVNPLIGMSEYPSSPIVSIDFIIFEKKVYFIFLPNEYSREERQKYLSVFTIKETDQVNRKRTTRDIDNLCFFETKKSLINY